MHRRLRVLPLLVLPTLVLAGCGGGDSEKADQTVDVIMTDNAFTPNKLSFPQGTTVRFVFKNEGEHAHEAVFGNEEAQEEHEQQMKEQPHMHTSEAKDFVEVHEGETGDLTWTFDEKGTTIIGCHEQEPVPHWEQGMKIDVTVT